MACRDGSDPLPVEGEFVLLLTHDVDRPYKSLQAPYYALRDRDPGHLRALKPSVNPWWQFETVMEMEADLGVRSAFYFLREPSIAAGPMRNVLTPRRWVEHLGRYDLDDQRIVEVVGRLVDGGWEVGLHGSSDAYDDRDRLRFEKDRLEAVTGTPVAGGRQHCLNLSIPETWRHHAAIGLDYDASLGTSSRYGFRFGYRELRPFDDEFVVFPTTLMEKALPSPRTDFETARADCARLVEEARNNRAVMTVLWHPRVFADGDFPGYRRLYRWLVEYARERGAWIGPPREFYRRLEDGGSSTAATEPGPTGATSP
jgi:hypothetical protein